jgi:hypothetical protein
MDYGSGNSSAYLATVLAIYATILGVSLVIGLVFYVLTGLSFMKLFRKVGIEPWAAWVPIFNVWRILELGGQPGWLALIALIPYGSTVTAVFEAIGAYKTGIAFRKDGSWVVLFIFLPFVWAWMLANENLPYEPHLIGLRGYKPPLVGYGSVRGPYTQQPGTPPQGPPPAA